MNFNKENISSVVAEYQELTEAVERVVDALSPVYAYDSVDLDSWWLLANGDIEISWTKWSRGDEETGGFKFPCEYILKTPEELQEVVRLKKEEREAAKKKKAEDEAAAAIKRKEDQERKEYERLRAKFENTNSQN